MAANTGAVAPNLWEEHVHSHVMAFNQLVLYIIPCEGGEKGERGRGWRGVERRGEVREREGREGEGVESVKGVDAGKHGHIFITLVCGRS